MRRGRENPTSTTTSWRRSVGYLTTTTLTSMKFWRLLRSTGRCWNRRSCLIMRNRLNRTQGEYSERKRLIKMKKSHPAPHLKRRKRRSKRWNLLHRKRYRNRSHPPNHFRHSIHHWKRSLNRSKRLSHFQRKPPKRWNLTLWLHTIKSYPLKQATISLQDMSSTSDLTANE